MDLFHMLLVELLSKLCSIRCVPQWGPQGSEHPQHPQGSSGRSGDPGGDGRAATPGTAEPKLYKTQQFVQKCILPKKILGKSVARSRFGAVSSAGSVLCWQNQPLRKCLRMVTVPPGELSGFFAGFGVSG